MFFTVFNRVKNKPYIAIIIYVLIAFYIITSNGCQTVTSERYSSDDLILEKRLCDVSHIILKDGTYINAEGKEISYYKRYGDSSNVLVINSGDSTIRVIENGKQVMKIIKIQSIIPLSKVKEVYITKQEFSPGKTLILSVGISIGIAILTIFAFLMAFAAAGGPG